MRFENETIDRPNYQGNAAVNYTDSETPWTRIIEHKWFEFGKDSDGNDIPKTIISKEFSSEWKDGDEPYYPVNDEVNTKLLEEYKKLALNEEVPSELKHDGNSYRADFYPLYRNWKYRLRDERWNLYRVNLHKELDISLE